MPHRSAVPPSRSERQRQRHSRIQMGPGGDTADIMKEGSGGSAGGRTSLDAGMGAGWPAGEGGDGTCGAPAPAPAPAPTRSRRVSDYKTRESLRKALASNCLAGQDCPPQDIVITSEDLAAGGMWEGVSPPPEVNGEEEASAQDPYNNGSDWMLSNLDGGTSRPQNLEQEMERLRVLKSYKILDEERDPSIERITGLAQRIFSVPIALISLIDLGRQWFMSNR